MRRNVKNTIIDTVLDTIAPHYCYACGEIGGVLCDHCKYDIDIAAIQHCFACKQPLPRGAICSSCCLPYSRQWAVGVKSDMLEQMIYDFKFERRSAVALPLAELLSETIGRLPRETVVVPIPTIAAHIRQRGYDHAVLIAEHLASLQDISSKQLISRKTNTRQRGATRSQRLQQASEAFELNGRVDPYHPHLLVDDVTTTGATLAAAAAQLGADGATTIWAACITYQALDGRQ